MDWQWPAVGVSIALAAAYVARQTWRTWSAKKAGCGGCSCAGKTGPASAQDGSTLISPSELTARLRRN